MKKTNYSSFNDFGQLTEFSSNNQNDVFNKILSSPAAINFPFLDAIIEDVRREMKEETEVNSSR